MNTKISVSSDLTTYYDFISLDVKPRVDDCAIGILRLKHRVRSNFVSKFFHWKEMLIEYDQFKIEINCYPETMQILADDVIEIEVKIVSLKIKI